MVYATDSTSSDVFTHVQMDVVIVGIGALSKILIPVMAILLLIDGGMYCKYLQLAD